MSIGVRNKLVAIGVGTLAAVPLAGSGAASTVWLRTERL